MEPVCYKYDLNVHGKEIKLQRTSFPNNIVGSKLDWEGAEGHIYIVVDGGEPAHLIFPKDGFLDSGRG